MPARRHRRERTIQKSRFITTLGRAATAEEAHAFVGDLREEFGDATHNCWAFVAGPPGSSNQVGMSDDGEPHGTAGRPMLTALLHGGVGEIVAVVTRYYGGVKLGKGGLGRAYSGGVVDALESLPRGEKVDRVPVLLTLEHGDVPGARRVFDALDATVEEETWGNDVRFRLAVPTEVVSTLKDELGGVTRGRARLSLPST